MLSLLLIFALIRLLQRGSFDREYSDNVLDLYSRDDTINRHFNTREPNDIIVSCFATIIACTWTTIHPNIPAPNESGWESLKRRVFTMMYALLAPETVTGWAMRQYIGARRITTLYNKRFIPESKRPIGRKFIAQVKHYAHEWIYGVDLPAELAEGEARPWTITHGFFVQMGGFMLCRKGRPVKIYAGYHQLGDDIEKKIIDAPAITEAEIFDRSKGDFLAKAFVIVQTTWFITQCIARWSARLPVTELEVVTLGFAMLNGLTYAFWWNKPQNVGLPVYLEGNISTLEPQQVATDEQETPVRDDDLDLCEDIQGLDEFSTPRTTNIRSTLTKIKALWKRRGKATEPKSVAVQEEVLPTAHSKGFFLQQMEYGRKNFSWWQRLGRIPFVVVIALLRPLAKLLQFSFTDDRTLTLRVPMYSSYLDEDDDEVVYIASSIIACLFGLVHLIPSPFLQFPSHLEKLLWRIFSSIITGQPIVLGLLSKWTNGKFRYSKYRYAPYTIIALAGLPFYIIARVGLLLLALLSLRDLSQGALTAIDWESFIPHV